MSLHRPHRILALTAAMMVALLMALAALLLHTHQRAARGEARADGLQTELGGALARIDTLSGEVAAERQRAGRAESERDAARGRLTAADACIQAQRALIATTGEAFDAIYQGVSNMLGSAVLFRQAMDRLDTLSETTKRQTAGVRATCGTSTS